MLTACTCAFGGHRGRQCQYCRVLNQLDDKNRLKLEYKLRPYAYFITCTYSDEYLFKCGDLATLYKPDLDSLIDRVRKKIPKVTIYAVGEYGGSAFGTVNASRFIHPHYHLAVFSAYKLFRELVRKSFCESWHYGHCHILELSGGLIDYITGYHSVKLTNPESMKKIKGLEIRPEFRWSSRRPAVGDISEYLTQMAEEYGIIPSRMIVDGKKVVIPEFLRRKVLHKILTHDLDVSKSPAYPGSKVMIPNNREDYAIYLERRKSAKEEKMYDLFEKQEEENEEILVNPNLVGSLESRKRELKKQLVSNFAAKKMRKFSKGKVL